jgi:hypothetical protein
MLRELILMASVALGLGMAVWGLTRPCPSLEPHIGTSRLSGAYGRVDDQILYCPSSYGCLVWAVVEGRITVWTTDHAGAQRIPETLDAATDFVVGLKTY